MQARIPRLRASAECFDYYPPAGSRFAIVEQYGVLSRHDSDTKVASSK